MPDPEQEQEQEQDFVAAVIKNSPKTTKECMELMLRSMEKMAEGDAKDFAQATIDYLESKKLSTKLKILKADVEPKIAQAAQRCRKTINDAAGQVMDALKKAKIEDKAKAVARALGAPFQAVGLFAEVVAKAVYKKIPSPVIEFADKCKRMGEDFISRSAEIGRNAAFLGGGVAEIIKEGSKSLALQAAQKIGQALNAAGAKLPTKDRADAQRELARAAVNKFKGKAIGGKRGTM